MTDRIEVGDKPLIHHAFYVKTGVQATATFRNGDTKSVPGTLTDPTTVTLVVTKPDLTVAGTYTFAGGTVAKFATGIFDKSDLAVDVAGTWSYKWTGTGTVVDEKTGYFSVWPLASADLLNILSLGEGQRALPLVNSTDEKDASLLQFITGLSRRIDELCGPVVARSLTELHDGGDSYIRPFKTPVYSVTTLTEYDNTTGTVLSVESNSSKPANAYLIDRNSALSNLVYLLRRSSNADSTFPSGRRNVELVYQAGRYANTAAVDAKFKMAAGAILRRLWDREAGAWARGANPLEAAEPGSRFFNAIQHVVNEQLAGELQIGIA